MAVTINRLSDTEWPTLRDLRLRALADAPDAFWATLEDESRFEEADWIRFLTSVAWFVARQDGRDVGLAGGLRREEHDHPEVIGMWVEPSERRGGTATLLLQAVCNWADEYDAGEVVLWVTTGNDAARLFYERNGFRLTGERVPLPSPRTGVEERMRRASQASAAPT